MEYLNAWHYNLGLRLWISMCYVLKRKIQNFLHFVLASTQNEET